MNDMINYLTTKNQLLVAMLAFILPFSFARAEVKEDGKTISQGWSDMTRRTSVGLLAYMGAIVSTPYSRQSYLPSMEK